MRYHFILLKQSLQNHAKDHIPRWHSTSWHICLLHHQNTKETTLNLLVLKTPQNSFIAFTSILTNTKQNNIPRHTTIKLFKNSNKEILADQE